MRKEKDPKNGSIYLKPTQFVLGIGCRRNTAFENIDRAIRQSLLKLQIDISDIDMIASIDVKKDEPGIKEFCERNRIDFVTYTADELMAVQENSVPRSLSGSMLEWTTCASVQQCLHAAGNAIKQENLFIKT